MNNLHNASSAAAHRLGKRVRRAVGFAIVLGGAMAVFAESARAFF